MRSLRLLALPLAVSFAAGCTCGKENGTPTEPLTAPKNKPPLDLKELPKPPELSIAQEGIPGSGELTVVAARPNGDVFTEVRPTVTFNLPVKSLEQVEAQRAADAANPFATIEPKLEGEWRWLGSASAEFVPSKLVPYSNTYTVTVKKGLKALDGSALKDDYSFKFNTPKLALQATHPDRGFKWLKPDDTINLLFNQPVKDAELLAALHLEVKGKPGKLQVMKRVSIQDERREEIEKAKKDHKPYSPLGDDERGWKNQQVRYTLAPDAPFPLDATISITIDGTLHGEQGPNPIGTSETLSFNTYGPMRFTEANTCNGQPCSYGPVYLFSTNPIDLPTLKDKLKITPPVEIDWDGTNVQGGSNYYAPHVVLAGKWKPGTQYSLEIAPGVADEFKQTDSAGFKATVQTEDLSPSFEAGSFQALIESIDDSPKFPVEVANVKSIDVVAWRPTDAELAKLGALPPYAGDQRQVKRAPDWKTHLALKYPRNVGRVHPVELKAAFNGAKTGVVLLKVTSSDVKDREDYALVQVTDLAPHVKLGPAKSLVWVTRLSTAQAVEGAEVKLLDSTGNTKWTGTTDKDGFADAPGAESLGFSANPEREWEVPTVLALASKDGDRAFTASDWSTGVEPYEFNLSTGWEGKAPESTSFAFTDRGIYRPGDTVFIKGVVRYRVLGELKAPDTGSVLTSTTTDSRGNKVDERQVKTTGYGTFSYELKIPKDAPLGYFSVSAVGDAPGGKVNVGAGFRVEEYRAPQFRVDVEAPKKELLAGDPLEAKAFARYLFGGAMTDAKTKWSVQRTPDSFRPAGYDDFTFEQEMSWDSDHSPDTVSGFFAGGDGRMDAKGELPIAAGQTEAPGGKKYTYTIEAEVEDVNRQTVAGSTTVDVHPASTYVGLKIPSGFMTVGQPYNVEGVVLGTDGKKAADRAFTVSVASRTWKSIRQKDASGGFTTVSEPEEKEVSKCDLKSKGDVSVPCSFKPEKGGVYVFRASVTDDKGRKHNASVYVYALGSDFVAWQRDDTDKLELVVDKPSYDVGDTAKILVKSPYPEADAMFTLEREGVLERRRIHLKGSVSAVEVPITEAMIPNVFVGVLMVHPRTPKDGVEPGDDPNRPAARIGLAQLKVEKKSKRLSVALKTDKPQYQPGEEVTVSAEVSDFKKSAADGELTLYVVDEAVLRLTDYQTPDPLTAIIREHPLSVRLGEPLLNLVRRRSYGEKGESRGGGGGEGEGKGMRTNFKTTAIFSPTVETKGGKATVKFKLPDNLTTFRVMGVLITKADRFGSGDTTLQVAKPVMALPALPRFARVGDQFEAGVVVHVRGPGAAEATVHAEAEGLKLDGAAEQKIAVAEGSPKEVRFKFHAEKAGLAKLRFKVVRGGDSDGVEQPLPVQFPAQLEAVATYGDTTGDKTEGVAAPKDVNPDLGGLQVTLSSTALGNFGAGFQQLIDYPYGCLEQQSSRLVPFIALREIAGQFKIPWPGPDEQKQAKENNLNAWLRAYLFDTLDVSQLRDPDQVINATVKSILALQDEDGAFRYWSDSTCSSSWQSAYASMALFRAREVGFDVPPERLTRATDYLQKVAGGQCHRCELSCPDETRTFAAYVLARMKKPKPGVYNELYARRDKLSLFSQSLLANAMFVGGGDKAKAKTLLTEIMNNAKESAKGLHLEESNSATYAPYWGSDTRTTGVVLQALTDISPDHPYVGKMAHYLQSVREGDGQWRTTQEAAWSLMALTEVLRTKEKDTPDFKAQVKLAANVLAEEQFTGRSLDAKTRTIPMPDLLKGGVGNLVFHKDGPGVLYYSATLKYAPKTVPTTPLENGLFVQRWFEPFAGGGQTTKFYAGDLVRVRVRVASNQERSWAAFEVPLPAGLEPVDTSLATTAKLPHSNDEEQRGVGYDNEGEGEGEGGSADENERLSPWAYGFWSPFNHTEMRDSKVVLFSDHLPPGVHTNSFVARATTPGTYVLQPARGELMYEPEVWGRSEGGTFEVALPTEVSQVTK